VARDPVLQWAADARAAEQETGVPASVLLGLTRVESGGVEGLTSSAGAGGLTQFMPGTAPAYGVDVRPGHSRSQLVGAGKYLKALGWSDNEADQIRALRRYNGGTRGEQIASTLTYARNVLAAARDYLGIDGPGGNPLTGPAPASTSPSSGRLIDAEQHSTLVTFGLSAALVIAAVAAIVAGTARATGARPPAKAAV
jgi:membrane-bound lytic murein transglycosylase B